MMIMNASAPRKRYVWGTGSQCSRIQLTIPEKQKQIPAIQAMARGWNGRDASVLRVQAVPREAKGSTRVAGASRLASRANPRRATAFWFHPEFNSLVIKPAMPPPHAVGRTSREVVGTSLA